MFDEDEWAELRPLLEEDMRAVKDYRAEHEVALSEVPLEDVYARALEVVERVTGSREPDPQVLWHHRRADFGVTCERCGRPRRTSKASRCVDCPT